MSFDTKDFRNALGHFATGITVISTVDHDGKPVGITANSFNSVSLDPPLVLFSLAKTAFSLAAFANHRHFAVNILQEGQEDLSNRFARPSEDKFAGVWTTTWESGCPILMDAMTCFECKVRNIYDGGDHLIFVGEVVRLFNEPTGRPLIFFQGKYTGLARDDEP